MLCFPQLSTGAVAQLPLRTVVKRRAVINELLNGKRISAADPDAATVKWLLQYHGLTDVERSELETFFRSAEGRLRPFVFLDPASNILRWSEDLSNDAWAKDGLLRVTAGIDDPTGGHRASRIVNGAQLTQGVGQTAPVPGWLHYCGSAYVRADAPCGISVELRNSDGAIRTTAIAGTDWQRVFCTGAIGGSAEDLTFRFETDAGAAVDVYGLQLEAQPAPSAYRKTTSDSGVHPATRFDQDRIAFTANGIDDHSTSFVLISNAGV